MCVFCLCDVALAGASAESNGKTKQNKYKLLRHIQLPHCHGDIRSMFHGATTWAAIEQLMLVYSA